MVVFTYKILLALFTLAVALLFVAGLMTGWTLYVAGVTAFGLIYFGMMFILPFNITHGEASTAERTAPEPKRVREPWNPADMAMRQLKFH